MGPGAIPLAMNAFGNFTSAPWIGQVDVPTAVVVTDQDKVVPTRRQLKLAESIPGAFVHRAPGGHTSAISQVRYHPRWSDRDPWQLRWRSAF